MNDSLQALNEAILSAFRVEELPALPVASVEDLRRRVSNGFDFDRPHALPDLIGLAAGLLRDGAVHTPHPRYFGLFNPAVTEGSVAGDALVAAFNPQLAAYSHSPAAQEIERHTIRALASRMGLPEATTGHFTSGGSEANQTAVLLALTHHFPSFGDDGAASLPGAPRMYVSELAHDSFTKIAHSAGIGRRAVRKVPVDEDLRMDMPSLREAIAEDRAGGSVPFMVVGTAGTTAGGAIDPLQGLALLAEDEGLWFHVDAAWGGGALISERRRSLMTGIDRAHSVTFDAHKWLSVPMGAGMIFTRHAATVGETFRVAAGYMPNRTEHGLDPFVSSLQWSRRFTGMKVAMSLAHLGWDGYADIVERQFSLADELRERLVSAGWIVLNRTELPLVLFSHPSIESGKATFEEVLDRVYAQNDAWISIAPLRPGRRALRACITSIHTRSEDVERLVEICEQARQESS
ncbi:pyridoxal phosphate-dependent decarboxylase family protein [Fimbriimonas ginsengisoli]|uniref:Pyridoxal-dependent decarboxylase domain protein n=1 Tax=Fimbriimonas ginsengisoli Gsoil 348 TaxID=661478 RepID=A0A068NRV7_FIMGI|nr:pyridoxal-dependent decarboxylase [Fimbriimonas ginsengisoli]AIE86171.1 pyridoxal-dependent decarboxylase domain protein [Fimbriimonas ginsengisoli Gsoil 348]